MGMLLYITMVMGWECEYGHGNEREWDRKSDYCTSLGATYLNTHACSLFMTFRTRDSLSIK